MLCLGVVAWCRPVLGYGLFLLLQTPVWNAAGGVAHNQLGFVILSLATLRLAMRRPDGLGRRRLVPAEVCALALSLIVGVRQFALLSSSLHGIGLCAVALFLAILWGPLLVAFNRLRDDEIACLRLWVSAAGIVVGAWGTALYVTGSDWLLRTALLGGREAFEVTGFPAGTDAVGLVRGRLAVMGLFTVTPAAYWYLLGGALGRSNKRWLWNAVMVLGAGAIVSAVAVSVTRSALLLLGIGTVVIVAPQLRDWRRHLRARALPLALGAAGVCVLGVTLYRGGFAVVIEEYRGRFATLGLDDGTVAARRLHTTAAWGYIREHFCVLGAPGPVPMLNYPDSGDTALIPYLWIHYGIPGMVLCLALLALAFSRLLRCWFSQRLDRHQKALRGMLTAWALLYVYWLFAGTYLQPAEVFLLALFASETERLHRKCLACRWFVWRRPALLLQAVRPLPSPVARGSTGLAPTG
jgi:hypothetical protein